MGAGVSFRTKLALVVVPPLIVIIILAAAVILPQLDKASGAVDDQDRVRIALLGMQLTDQVEIEQGLSARRVANLGAELAASLDAQRTATDAARQEFRDALDDLRSVAPDNADLAKVPLRLIDPIRALVDQNEATIDAVIDTYTQQVDELNAVTTTLVSLTTDSALLRRAAALTDQILAKAIVAEAVNRMAGRLEAGDQGTSDFVAFQNDWQNAQSFYARFRTSTDEVGRDRLDGVEAVAEVGTMAQEAERIIEAARNDGVYAVDPAEWWRVAEATVAAYDELDDSEFSRYLAAARENSSDARRTAILYSLAAVLGAALAVMLAFLLGRNLSRRLKQVTDSAHEIAVDRLPDVLDSLRNPTPEALAGAIPKVETTSTDEIGTLADSFNTVLRTAVETSIEHSTRRAETLTNLLVNLGRRNQALLERQLALIDTLEAREQDPAVLDGLFRLDHMVTRQRRNAESLLVLAGSRRSRAWAEPVPISDVIRGAISEVADMGRVDFEIPPGHDLLVTGSHSVDLSHLLAELIENATAYSSPTTSVQVRVQRSGLHVRVWVIDSGVGMSDEELTLANQKVADPPDIDELTTDRVGFQVVGRLARRLGAEVRLQINPAGGVAAGVDLPSAAFEPLTGDLPIVAVAEAETRAAASPITSLVTDDAMLADLAAETESVTAEHTVARADAPSGDGTELPRRPSTPSVSMPAGEGLPRRVPSTPGPSATPLFGRSGADRALAEPVRAVPADAPAPVSIEADERVAPAPVARGPEPNPVTPAGLTRRTPGAALNGSAPVAEAEHGLFRRLPTAADTNEIDPAERLRTLRAFSRGVDEGRREETPS